MPDHTQQQRYSSDETEFRHDEGLTFARSRSGRRIKPTQKLEVDIQKDLKRHRGGRADSSFSGEEEALYAEDWEDDSLPPRKSRRTYSPSEQDIFPVREQTGKSAGTNQKALKVEQAAPEKKIAGGIFKGAAIRILRNELRLMTTGEIARKALADGVIVAHGRTPDATMAASLYVDIKRKKDRSLFIRPSEGLFGLREWLEPGFDLEAEREIRAKSLSQDTSPEPPASPTPSIQRQYKPRGKAKSKASPKEALRSFSAPVPHRWDFGSGSNMDILAAAAEQVSSDTMVEAAPSTSSDSGDDPRRAHSAMVGAMDYAPVVADAYHNPAAAFGTFNTAQAAAFGNSTSVQAAIAEDPPMAAASATADVPAPAPVERPQSDLILKESQNAAALEGGNPEAAEFERRRHLAVAIHTENAVLAWQNEVAGDVDALSDAYMCVYKLYIAAGKLDKATEYLERSMRLRFPSM